MKDAKAIQFWHHDVTKDKVWLLGKCDLYANLSMFSSQYFVVGKFEDLSEVFPYIGLSSMTRILFMLV
jgi:hypothetical protein